MPEATIWVLPVPNELFKNIANIWKAWLEQGFPVEDVMGQLYSMLFLVLISHVKTHFPSIH